jgi:hypothetical protein
VTLRFRYPAASPGVNVIKLFFDSSLRSQQFKLEGLSLSSFSAQSSICGLDQKVTQSWTAGAFELALKKFPRT